MRRGALPVPAYFVSDVHLRLDRPDRALRFARWVERLSADDPITIAGDLCDFWFASRQRHADPMACPGLKALRAFTARNGSITIMTGNHDLWLGSFYEQTLGARLVREPLDTQVYGLRVHLLHGHLLGAGSLWKAALESRMFLRTFRLLPDGLAGRLEDLLEQSNEQRLAESDRRHLKAYHRYADQIGDRADLVVFGHIHRPRDESSRQPRLIVLGGWRTGQSFLKIDDSGATLVVGTDHQEPPV
jgi:UDP-2,3-diacylglucosamine hydrolase